MEKLEAILKKIGLNEDEAVKAISQLNKPQDFKRTYSLGNKRVLYGVISDSHIGHRCFDADLMEFASNMFKKRKVDFVVHGGDICEGHYENKRNGSVFELEHIGGDAQVERAIRELSKLEKPLFFITGNHCHNTFYKVSGFDIGKQIEKSVKDSHYLGVQDGSIKLFAGHKIQLLHPDGGSSYAISYKSQKIVESLEGGSKPAVLHIAHFHKAEYLFYRNIHVIQNGCLESQTPFMKNNHLSAHKGFWIIDLTLSKKGVDRIITEFYPSYGQ